ISWMCVRPLVPWTVGRPNPSGRVFAKRAETGFWLTIALPEQVRTRPDRGRPSLGLIATVEHGRTRHAVPVVPKGLPARERRVILRGAPRDVRARQDRVVIEVVVVGGRDLIEVGRPAQDRIAQPGKDVVFKGEPAPRCGAAVTIALDARGAVRRRQD